MPKISQDITTPSNFVFTWYSRDASGNVMATYQSPEKEYGGSQLKLIDISIYGSQRLGVLSVDQKLADLPEPGTPIKTMEKGNKHFELVNHLGNVLSVISDRLFSTQGTTLGKVARYTADLVSSSDYFPFGMQMSGRKVDSGKYRYGFNGKEKETGITGSESHYDFGARIYDGRIGRWLAVDPLVAKYPDLNPYNFVANNPIICIDPDGEVLQIISKDPKVREELFNSLKKLTSDEISMDANGVVTVVNKATNPDKELGTSIIDQLSSSEHEHLIDMNPGFDQNFNKAFIQECAENGHGSGSLIFLQGPVSLEDEDGVKREISLEILLGHELIHASHMDKGTIINKSKTVAGQYEPVLAEEGIDLEITQEEYNTRIQENQLRKEQKQTNMRKVSTGEIKSKTLKVFEIIDTRKSE